MKAFNEKGIEALYHFDETGRAVLDTLSNMPRQDETLIEAVERKIAKTHPEINRREIVTVFKRLNDLGCGEFIPGRRGHPSRFRWEVDSIRVSKPDHAAAPSREHAPPPPSAGAPADIFSAPTMLIPHRFQLRPDMVVTINLPSDLTPTEGYRLAQFINSLSFDTRVPGAV